VKGHVGIVVTGADETSHLSVFSVGRATAFDPTGTYNILAAPGPGNDPAANGSALFQGHGATDYDGVADIAFVAISSPTRKFGGLRTANVRYWSLSGTTGVYAPGIEFTGPIYLADITAMNDATPCLLIGSTQGDVRIAGGNLLQENGRSVDVKGLTRLWFTGGTTSAGSFLSAQANLGVLEQEHVDVTARLVRP
jgi:hypothetical protein